MSKPSLADAYQPTHDEAARQSFVGALKGFLNGPLEARLGAHYEQTLKPAFEAHNARAPANREEGLRALADDPLYQLWGSCVYTSQDLMWETVDDTCQRVLPDFVARRSQIDRENQGGRLELNPDLALPEPIRSVEIHRQEGGYFGEFGEYSMLTGLRYFGTLELYRAAKGMSADTKTGAPGLGFFILNAIKKRFGDLKPKRILDLGCGTGTETIAYAMAFPDAEIWGVDLSAPLLNFAHTWATDNGHQINWRQADARDTGFDEGSFDLIVSNILFHETWFDIVPQIMDEARRLLAPGGVFLNADTPYQPHQLSIPKQVTNHWQVLNNGEPFWTGYADLDMAEQLRNAGFNPEQVFADYDPLGQGAFHIFGAQKDAT
ncbi:MAG: class I SAM-dependent methyltransferase [Gammaproteobacteria bacterium]